MIYRITGGVIACVFVTTMAGCARQPGFPPNLNSFREVPIPASQELPRKSPYLGVYEPNSWASYEPISKFASATNVWPNIVLEYSSWDKGFRSAVARLAFAHHAELLVQMQPSGISMRAIAAGHYNSYLRAYAEQVRAFGHPVIIGFAHEMNGTWYSWGAGHVSPSVWVAAWRRVVTVFRRAGVHNVKWLWTIHNSGNASKLRLYWPGGAYVNWVGIDGYLQTPSDTFHNVFQAAIRAVQKITHEPILLSEVGVGPDTRHKAKGIISIFAGAISSHVLGIVWFDVAQHGSITRQDWRLEGSPAALAAFRRGVQMEVAER